MNKKYKYGLVLSGGGARGFAHLGGIAALYEKGIRPGIISGVSAGAIAGAFIAAGIAPYDVLKMFKKTSLSKFTKIHFPVDGLLKLNGIKEMIEKEIGAKNIEDLPIPFHICVSNLNTGKTEYKAKGPLGDTVLASSSIPVLFSPVKLGRYLYVDGGVMDNIPVSPLKTDCDELIISNISAIHPKAKLNNLVQIAMRTFYMSVSIKTEEAKKQAKYYIEPQGIDSFDIFSLKHAEKLYELGYQTTLKVLEEQRS